MVRYTALASGVLYGIVHRRTLTAQEHEKHLHEEQHKKERLLEQARQAWKDKSSPVTASRSSQFSTYAVVHSESQICIATVVTDPDDPKFDLEALVAAYEKH